MRRAGFEPANPFGNGISKIATKDKDFNIIAKVEHLEIMDSV